MMARLWRAARKTRLVGKTLLSGVMVCALTDLATPQDGSGGAYDVKRRPLDEIPAGTVVGREAPQGWTHLIVKSRARPGTGDLRALSPQVDRLSRLVFTAIVADVRPGPGGGPPYELARVAVGMGTTVRGQDMVLTPDTLRRLAPELGFVERLVLTTSHARLREVTVVARSPTMLLLDSPTMMVRDGQHRRVVLRHAVLVDGRTGHLDTLLWVLDCDEGDNYSGPVGAVQWLEPSQVADCVLHVDGREFTLGTPTEKAFAMDQGPRGRKEVSVGADLEPLLVRQRFSREAAAELEGKLHRAMQQAQRK
jgi:hypothetical protein